MDRHILLLNGLVGSGVCVCVYVNKLGNEKKHTKVWKFIQQNRFERVFVCLFEFE